MDVVLILPATPFPDFSKLACLMMMIYTAANFRTISHIQRSVKLTPFQVGGVLLTLHWIVALIGNN